MKRAFLLWTIPLTAIFAACAGPASTAREPPRLVSQPYFEAVLVDWALAYRAELAEPLPFDLATATQEEGVEMVEDGEAELLVSSGDPPQGWFATPLGPQAMAVIVHPDNPVRMYLR
jgi:DNA-binding transcriptional LysR family regulator